VPEARIRELAYRRWIDDPKEHLGGLSPRVAAARQEYREELERQLRMRTTASVGPSATA